MADLVIKCPTTGKVIKTGIRISKEAFDSSEMTNNTVGCPECGQNHKWDKKDAWLQD